MTSKRNILKNSTPSKELPFMTLENLKIITIDGPASSGKSTVAQIVSKSLGFQHLNTGSIYRALALLCLEENTKLTQKEEIKKHCDTIKKDYHQSLDSRRFFIGKRDITTEIKTPEISELTSKLSELPLVRKELLDIQRNFARKHNGVIVDGRDMGTVVFPNAPLNIFLTALPEKRAQRRFLELEAKNISCSLEDLIKEIKSRDARDEKRTLSPLKASHDAIIIDSSERSAKQVAHDIIKHAKHMLN